MVVFQILATPKAKDYNIVGCSSTSNCTVSKDVVLVPKISNNDLNNFTINFRPYKGKAK